VKIIGRRRSFSGAVQHRLAERATKVAARSEVSRQERSALVGSLLSLLEQDIAGPGYQEGMHRVSRGSIGISVTFPEGPFGNRLEPRGQTAGHFSPRARRDHAGLFGLSETAAHAIEKLPEFNLAGEAKIDGNGLAAHHGAGNRGTFTVLAGPARRNAPYLLRRTFVDP